MAKLRKRAGNRYKLKKMFFRDMIAFASFWRNLSKKRQNVIYIIRIGESLR